MLIRRIAFCLALIAGWLYSTNTTAQQTTRITQYWEFLRGDLGGTGGSRKVQHANGQASIRIAVNGGKAVVAAVSKGMETGMTQPEKIIH